MGAVGSRAALSLAGLRALFGVLCFQNRVAYLLLPALGHPVLSSHMHARLCFLSLFVSAPDRAPVLLLPSPLLSPPEASPTAPSGGLRAQYAAAAAAQQDRDSNHSLNGGFASMALNGDRDRASPIGPGAWRGW